MSLSVLDREKTALAIGTQVERALAGVAAASQELKKWKEEVLRLNRILRKAANSFSDHGLSRREMEVLEFVLEGKCNKEIAAELNITVRTAKFHVSSILVKTGCERRQQLIRREIVEEVKRES